jgi:hypothetical protein
MPSKKEEKSQSNRKSFVFEASKIQPSHPGKICTNYFFAWHNPQMFPREHIEVVFPVEHFAKVSHMRGNDLELPSSLYGTIFRRRIS